MATFNRPFVLHQHELTLQLSAAPSFSSFGDREISKLVLAPEEGHDETGSQPGKDPGGCCVSHRAASPPRSAVRQKERPLRGSGETHTELQRLSGSCSDAGRDGVLCQDRAASAF